MCVKQPVMYNTSSSNTWEPAGTAQAGAAPQACLLSNPGGGERGCIFINCKTKFEKHLYSVKSAKLWTVAKVGGLGWLGWAGERGLLAF